MAQSLVEIRSAAAAEGRRRLVSMSNRAVDLVLWVAADQDLDAAFPAVCADTGDRLWINGWTLELHDDTESRAELAAQYGDWRELLA